MDKILDVLGALPKKNDQIKDTQSGVGSAALVVVGVLIVLIVITFLIAKK